MPDLSQTTPSPSSSTSVQVCEPRVVSQDTTPDVKPTIRDSKEDEFSQPVSSSQPSPVFHGSFMRQPLVCVEKLSQDLINASTGTREQPCTQDTADGPSCARASQSQEDASEESESITQIPDEDLPMCQGHEGLSPKNTDQEECSSSPSRRSQPSGTRFEPKNADEDVTVKNVILHHLLESHH